MIKIKVAFLEGRLLSS